MPKHEFPLRLIVVCGIGLLAPLVLIATIIVQQRGQRPVIGADSNADSGPFKQAVRTESPRLANDATPEGGATQPVPASAAPVAPDYVIVEERRGGGNVALTMVIVIDPNHVNERDIRALGERLREETKKYDIVHVGIFDDMKAAGMAKNIVEETQWAPLDSICRS
jgi:hypothetical protein